MFQTFDTLSDPVTGDARLTKLRAQMAELGFDALLVPHADEYRNEYLPPCAERLAWISGFTGSAGEALILPTRAIIFVDGRYTLQATQQTDNDYWEVESLIDNPPHNWMAANLTDRTTVGFDAALHTANEVGKLEKALSKTGGSLRATDKNLVDTIWDERPGLPSAKVAIHDFELAGRTTMQKMTDIDKAFAENDADFCVLTDPSSICWLFNIRGSDVAHTPVVLTRAILRRDGEPMLHIDKTKLDIETRAFLTQVAQLRDPDDFVDDLAGLAVHARVMIDPDRTAFAVNLIVEQTGGTVVKAKDPVLLPRATKNDTEIQGSRNAHLRDGAAMATFLAWIDDQPPGSIDEITAAEKLENTRREMAGDFPLRDISFDTISGSGPNGAIVHYRVNESTNRTLGDGELYLSDSGGQYGDGTTDITRTVVIGKPDREQRRAFTLVLKGHIGIATARFPEGTRGMDIDVLARIALWQYGMDYAHGTGHGVGSYLSVHEGPQN
ncbi:MAG: M24 family metallopeptidase, partial [Rhizobiaceae bacterium]